MKTNVFGMFDFSFDGRKQSLLVSHAFQNFSDKYELKEKVNKEFMNFMELVPKMQPEHIVTVRWHSGYEFGYPTDYYGIGAISCKSIQPWKHHSVDHIIQDKNPFRKLPNDYLPIYSHSLLGKITFDYNSKERIGAKVFNGSNTMDGDDGFLDEFNFPDELHGFLEKESFNYKFYSMSSLLK